MFWIKNTPVLIVSRRSAIREAWDWLGCDQSVKALRSAAEVKATWSFLTAEHGP